MSCYQFKGIRPVVHESSFIHPLAAVTGNVIIGKNVYIGPGAAIRGDFGKIIIEDGCNIQENCTIHMFPGVNSIVEKVSDEMIQWKSAGTKIYQQLATDMLKDWKPCEPLRNIDDQKRDTAGRYKTWRETKKNGTTHNLNIELNLITFTDYSCKMRYKLIRLKIHCLF